MRSIEPKFLKSFNLALFADTFDCGQFGSKIACFAAFAVKFDCRFVRFVADLLDEAKDRQAQFKMDRVYLRARNATDAKSRL